VIAELRLRILRAEVSRRIIIRMKRAHRENNDEHAGAEAEEPESPKEDAGCTVNLNIRGRTDPVLFPLT
jgi:hypothetical protein